MEVGASRVDADFFGLVAAKFRGDKNKFTVWRFGPDGPQESVLSLTWTRVLDVCRTWEKPGGYSMTAAYQTLIHFKIL